jgi:hypothetical protein
MDDAQFRLLEQRVRKLESKVRSFDAFIVIVILTVATFWAMRLMGAG